MTRANPENYLYGYSYRGGMPPASLEVLAVGKDGLAQYIAGHPWPKQPPFDEIGIYQRELGKADLNDLLRIVAEARHSDTSGPAELHPADSGTEVAFAGGDGQPWRASWNPLEPPTGLKKLLDRTRALIADLREHPLSTLSVRLGVVEAEALESGLPGLQLRFSNRSPRPFTFFGFDSRSGQPAELRLQFCRLEELDATRCRSPIQLMQAAPIEVLQSGAEPVLVGPGEETSIQVSLPEGLVRRGNEPAGLLFGLLHLFWQVEGIDGYVEEGWLMPEPLEVR